MRKLILILLLFSPFILRAQNNRVVPSNLVGKTEKVEYSSRSNYPNIIVFSKKDAPIANNIKLDIAWAKSIYSFKETDGLVYLSEYVDRSTNEEFFKFQQTYNTIPVEYGTLKVKVLDSKIMSIIGDYYSEINPNNSISISKDAAIQSAKGDIGAISYESIKSSLVLLPIESNFLYAYKIELYTFQNKERYVLYIDAQSGNVLKKNSLMCTIDVKGNA